MQIHRPVDKRLIHREAGQAAIVSTAVLGTVIDQKAAHRSQYALQGFVEAIDIASNDELYQLVVELSDDNFTTVSEVAAIKDLGATEVRQSGANDSAAGDEFEILFSTEVNGVGYRYWRVNLVVAGTSPSITMSVFSSTL